jgi:predicted cobalt transporter CbtA
MAARVHGYGEEWHVGVLWRLAALIVFPLVPPQQFGVVP